MPENNIQRENLELKARLQAMGGILRLSHDAVLQPDLKSLAVHIVNNSRPLVQYVRSCLVAADGAAPRILAEMSQVEVNSHSEYANNIRLIASVLKIEAPQEISATGSRRRKRRGGPFRRCWANGGGSMWCRSPLRASPARKPIPICGSWSSTGRCRRM